MSTYKILHVVPTYLPATRYGGPIFSVHGLACAQVQAGHVVHVCTTNVDGPGDADVPLGEAVDVDGVQAWYFPSVRGRRLYFSPQMGRFLRQHVGDYDFVHLHSVFLWPTNYAARQCLKQQVPYVLSPRGMLVPDLIRSKSRLLKSTWLRLFERKTIRNARALIFSAKRELDDYAQMRLPTRPTIINPNGVSAVPDSQLAKRKKNTFLFLGRYNWKKGLDLLLEAIALLPQELTLICIGIDDEGYQATMQQMAEQLGVEKRVTFLGPKYGTEKQQYLAQARCLVVPSRSENFANVVVESMAQGTPVITHPEVGASDHVTRAYAGLVVPRQASALAEAMQHAQGAQWDVWQENCKPYVREHLTWPRIAASLHRALKPVLEKTS